MSYDENRISDQIDGGLIQEKNQNDKKFLNEEISNLKEMPLPLKNALQANGIIKLNQVIFLNRHEIRMLKNFGNKRIEMLKEFLTKNKIDVSSW